MEKHLYVDMGCQSINKFGEDICGDDYKYARRDDNTAVLVMADGLGTGESANKLSTTVTSLALDMLKKAKSVEETVLSIEDALSQFKEHRIAYSTFSLLDIQNDLHIKIIQYDNPDVIMLREGKHIEFPKEALIIGEKKIYVSTIKIKENDIFIAMSDGAVHAGIGKSLNFGWTRDDIIRFLENLYRKEHTAKMITTILLDQCRLLYEDEAGDDTTVCTMKIKPRHQVNILLGPPKDRSDDNCILSLFFSKEGKHIVSGGSTSTIVARYLGKELVADINAYFDPAIPPTAEIEGVDLVTEGIVTMTKVLFYAKDYLVDNTKYMEWSRKQDGASQMAKLLFESATDINFFIGKAVNVAHQSPSVEIGFDKKMKITEELVEALDQMGKKVSVMYL